ncbi:hypothetical protein CVT26_012541 [Gymnopilus dilepis]|uniref:Uncharacterized protein n=1 Tax=Gymnopilus dilepis TaxID=231916 RepID=A0A409WAH4_9AGAR|nr:hypothetical protein CVT26_012541 [Gymnopilus dilepis]
MPSNSKNASQRPSTPPPKTSSTDSHSPANMDTSPIQSPSRRSRNTDDEAYRPSVRSAAPATPRRSQRQAALSPSGPRTPSSSSQSNAPKLASPTSAVRNQRKRVVSTPYPSSISATQATTTSRKVSGSNRKVQKEAPSPGKVSREIGVQASTGPQVVVNHYQSFTLNVSPAGSVPAQGLMNRPALHGQGAMRPLGDPRLQVPQVPTIGMGPPHGLQPPFEMRVPSHTALNRVGDQHLANGPQGHLRHIRSHADMRNLHDTFNYPVQTQLPNISGLQAHMDPPMRFPTVPTPLPAPTPRHPLGMVAPIPPLDVPQYHAANVAQAQAEGGQGVYHDTTSNVPEFVQGSSSGYGTNVPLPSNTMQFYPPNVAQSQVEGSHNAYHHAAGAPEFVQGSNSDMTLNGTSNAYQHYGQN